jgi:O-antigen ligase
VAFVLAGWHTRRLQSVVRPLLTLVLAGSLVFGILKPSLAIHQETSSELLGAWRGLTNHKNSLGALSCMTLIFWVESWLARETKTLWALAGSALAVTCLLLSRSSTSLIAALFATLLLALLAKGPRAVQPFIKFGCTLLVVMLVIYALAILKLIPGLQVLLAPVALLTGSDMTFTGRSEIWAIMTEHISLNPLLGTGYGAYWTGPSPQSPSYEFIMKMQSFYPGSAHNGYLEVTNDLGWIGLAFLLGYLTIHLRQSLQVLAIGGAQGGLYLALFIQQAISNLSESHWFSVLSVHFVMMTLASAALARLLLEQRLRARHGEPIRNVQPEQSVQLTPRPASALALNRLRRQP